MFILLGQESLFLDVYLKDIIIIINFLFQLSCFQHISTLYLWYLLRLCTKTNQSVSLIGLVMVLGELNLGIKLQNVDIFLSEFFLQEVRTCFELEFQFIRNWVQKRQMSWDTMMLL
eukprot:TRINITY_DN139323_c0_g1_i1.p4 TRINITY_DN139323_c0_g1~~TRINITY_DN139323_c0_g1_i1.p4  ORF type:complete len:116 (-),score=4.20 TRINITY_DN139323_c0_g1_i1:150-497(-)